MPGRIMFKISLLRSCSCVASEFFLLLVVPRAAPKIIPRNKAVQKTKTAGKYKSGKNSQDESSFTGVRIMPCLWTGNRNLLRPRSHTTRSVVCASEGIIIMTAKISSCNSRTLRSSSFFGVDKESHSTHKSKRTSVLRRPGRLAQKSHRHGRRARTTPSTLRRPLRNDEDDCVI